ncbi:family 78 glycoside hydrolase catalytic domain [Pedobacter immunditicola]|uniref:family 78 glycoside hydrolase catalytic domain n=1 Tax=Pedobacter immunditicola TaxID=3133440 RepID=UPI00309A9EAD
MKRYLIVMVYFLGCLSVKGQDLQVNSALLSKSWPSRWISCPDVPQKDYGVFHFRKSIKINAVPQKFVIHVSADNRYRFFVNGQPVLLGPARGDLYNWYFETVDIAPYLKAGENILAAMVWNMGTHAPVAQVSNQTAFLVQGDTQAEQIVNTDHSWKVYKNPAYSPCSTDNGPRLKAYMVIGPGDQVDAGSFPWGWELLAFDDKNWVKAASVTTPVPFGKGTDNLWTLVPRNIPHMEETKQRILSVRRAEGIKADDGFLKGKHQLVIPPNQKISILLDQTFNTVAYPELLVSKGKGAAVKMTYAEALVDINGNKKNRNEIENMHIQGNYDVFIADGGEKRTFRPLWLRTYRYLQLDITTSAEPLIVEDLYGMYTGYPFEEKASFSSSDPSLNKIWDVGWRTARLCAGETYYDCPYYEQLQYEADTRIQALISLYVSGDDRLARKAILDFYHSMVPEGLTQGRYPSNRLQVIPPFSLWWVSMIYDYSMHRDDKLFTAKFLTGINSVLDWYDRHMDKDKGMLGPMPWWNFVDYTDVFPNGVPDGADDGNSAVITLQYVYTLQQAAKIFEYHGQAERAKHYQELATKIGNRTYNLCFDKNRGLMANTPEMAAFSQHASIMGVLTNAIPKDQYQEVMRRVLEDKTIGPATFYYRFYLNQALKEADMANLYYGQLTPWRDMLANGLTTFAEKPEPARSDCHAWSASPNYDFLATICGIMPANHGFSAVNIKPALGELKNATGTMPHPLGLITVVLKRKGKMGLSAKITLPSKLSGKFMWNKKIIELSEGSQEFNVE